MKTHCPYGHPYWPENTQTRSRATRRWKGKVLGPYFVRECKTCKQIVSSIAYFKKKAEQRGGWMPPLEQIVKRIEKRHENRGQIPGRSLGDFPG
jgi:hypothetical protein